MLRLHVIRAATAPGPRERQAPKSALLRAWEDGHDVGQLALRVEGTPRSVRKRIRRARRQRRAAGWRPR